VKTGEDGVRMSSKKPKRARPASRVLALIMGVSLIIVGLAGLAWHLIGVQAEWLFGNNIGLDIFHLAAGVLALGAGGTKVSAKGFGWLAFIVFTVAMLLAAMGSFLEKYAHVAPGVPHFLAENTLGFSDVNYILYLLMGLWGLLVAHSAIDIADTDTGEKHDIIRALPDREDVINANRQLTQTHD
jgi:predicted membrane channel-forming protein YqfA (hemolysin III family)